MNPLRVAAVFRRIVAQFRRDPRSLALLYLAPLAIIALLGWVLSSAQTTTARVAVVDESGSPAGTAVAARLSAALDGQPGIRSTNRSPTMPPPGRCSKDKKLDLVVILPPDFSVENRKIELLTLGLNPAGEASVIPAVQSALVSAVVGSAGAVLPTIEHQTVYGSPDATQLDSLAPVVVGFFAYFFVFILTGISFLRERIGGTLERLLATPVSRAEIVLGYSLGFGFFATLQVAIVLAFVLGRLQIPALGPVRHSRSAWASEPRATR